MSTAAPVVFLVDVDNTLLDNDAVLDDLRRHVQWELGQACWERYRDLLVKGSEDLGYRDYLGALQQYRAEHPYDSRLPRLSLLLQDYPFGQRLYPSAIAVIARLRSWGRTVLLTDGDIVFQPRKVAQCGLWRAVSGHVLIYVHKEQELADIETRYPADHYVLIDDKVPILAAVKRRWGSRVTTVLSRQGRYALDPSHQPSHLPPDITIANIADLLTYDLSTLLAADLRRHASELKVVQFQPRPRVSNATSSLARREQP